MMTRLAGMLEEYLQGSAPPAFESTTKTAEKTLMSGSGRMIGDKTLTEVLSETGRDTKDSGDKPEEKMWNEFTN